ncbi:MAG: hypothetical protein WC526_02475 [Patescibacteria group bacterium]
MPAQQLEDHMTRFALICSLFSVLALGNLGCMEGLTAEEIAACSNEGQEFCPDATGALVCVDTLTDDHNCGACGFLCTNGAQCVAGVCDCSGNETLSAGCPVPGKIDAVMCVDLKDDPLNCGACGNICPSGLCADYVCIPVSSTCTDGIKDGAESDVDCGDGCAKCINGKMCRLNSDCVSGYCNASGICADAPVGACFGKASGTLCRAAVSDCDVAEYCDGVHADCPADGFQAFRTACHVSGDGNGTCSGNDAVCRPPTGLCSNVTCGTGLVCDPTDGICKVPDQVTCFGLGLSDPGPDAVNCIWWARGINNAISAFTPHDNVSVAAPPLACALTCYKADGSDATPTLCSGQWQNGMVQNWSASGGHLLAGGHGCAWDNKYQSQ